MSASTSCTAYCKVTTKSGTTTIGSSVIKSFTVNVPSTVVPTAGELTLTPSSIKIGNTTYTDILVQNKNGLTASVGTCTAGTGSSIASYTFSGPGFPGTEITSTSSSISSVPSYGDSLTYKVTVKDKRGRSAVKSKTIKCYQYYNPSFKAGSFNAYRVTEQEDGSYLVDPNGTKLMCEWTPVIASVGGRNKCSTVITYTCNGVTKSTDPIYGDHAVIDLGESEKTYSVTAKLTDSFGATASSTDNSEPITVNGAARIINVASNSLGLAIGKMSSVDDDYEDTNGLFECAWDAHLDNDLYVKNDLYINNKLLNKVLVDLIYPVGSIYMSVNKDIDPGSFFGGTWVRWGMGRTILGAGAVEANTYTSFGTVTAGSFNHPTSEVKGGEYAHTLTEAQMPQHKHTLSDSGYRFAGVEGTAGISDEVAGNIAGEDYHYPRIAKDRNWGGFTYTSNVGSSSAHNNIQPYITCYMWKRTA